jgi:hypothetical protein
MKHRSYNGAKFKYLLRFGNVPLLPLLKLLFNTSYLKTYTLYYTSCSASYLVARKTEVPEIPSILNMYNNVY